MQTETVFCPHCGKAAGGRFCGYCGAPSNWQQPFRRETPAANASLNVAKAAAAQARQLFPLFIEPFRRPASLPRAAWRTAAIVGATGVVPLLITTGNDELAQYWEVALYFSILWGVFFYFVFRPRQFRIPIALGAFFFTGLVSMTLLLALLSFGLEALRDPLVRMQFAPVAIPSSILFIGVPEELTKALAVFLIARFVGIPPLRTFLVYGLISGLGFGIYEGVNYQTGVNLQVLDATNDPAMYYLSNMLRLTSLPFLHATWTGIAAYLIWLGHRFPAHRLGLFVLAIAIPAMLHGLYDGIQVSGLDALGWAVALLGAILLCIYIATADTVQQRLAEVAA